MVRKSRFILLLLLVGCWRLWAQSPPQMTVVHLAGAVSRLSDGKVLEIGQPLTTTEGIKFGSSSQSLLAWEPVAGLIWLKPKPAGKKPSVLSGAAASFATPIPATSTSGRLERFSNLKQLVPHFQGRKYLLLGRSWLIATPPFDLNGDSVLIVKFRNVKEDYQVGPRLRSSNDTLLLDPKLILDMNGKPVPAAEASDFRLWWFNKSSRKFEEIASFEFVFADETQVQREVQGLLGLMKDKPVAAQYDAAYKFILAAFGEPDAHNYKQWVAQHFPELTQATPAVKSPAPSPAPQNSAPAVPDKKRKH